MDSIPCGISHVKDVATFKLELLPELDCVSGVVDARVGDGQLEMHSAAKINMSAVKLELDLIRQKVNKSDDALVRFCSLFFFFFFCVNLFYSWNIIYRNDRSILCFDP